MTVVGLRLDRHQLVVGRPGRGRLRVVGVWTCGDLCWRVDEQDRRQTGRARDRARYRQHLQSTCQLHLVIIIIIMMLVVLLTATRNYLLTYLLTVQHNRHLVHAGYTILSPGVLHILKHKSVKNISYYVLNTGYLLTYLHTVLFACSLALTVPPSSSVN